MKTLFAQPKHPYSQLLMASLPSLAQKDLFRGIKGYPLLLLKPPPAASSIRAALMQWRAVKWKRQRCKPLAPSIVPPAIYSIHQRQPAAAARRFRRKEPTPHACASGSQGDHQNF